MEDARRWLERPEPTPLPEFFRPVESDLPAPTGLRAADGELRAVPLRWDPILVGDVGGYWVERAESPDGPWKRVAVVAGASSTVWVDRGPAGSGDSEREDLGDGTTLFYRVRVFSVSGEVARAVSEPVEATTAPPPEPPEGLRAYSHQPRQVPLSWDASDDPTVTGYEIERSPSSGGPYETLATVEGRYETVYLDAGLGDLRVFYYRVLAVNADGGRGRPSEAVRAMTKPDPLPPIGLTVARQRLGRNDLTWEPNVETDLAGYRLLRIRDDESPPEVVASPKADTTRGADREVGADETVSYRVVALDRDGLESDASAPVRVASVGYDLHAEPEEDGVHLTWNARADEGWSGARIYVHGALGISELAFVEGDEYVHRGVQPGHHYRYSVVLERDDATRAPASTPVEITAR
jgi:hypothetical protein